MYRIISSTLRITVVCFLLFPASNYGQTIMPFYRYYATQAYATQLAKQNSKMDSVRSAIERQVFQFRRSGVPQEVVIPVVFHILVNNVDTVITPEAVNAQLLRLNTDFYDVSHPYLSEAYKYPSGNNLQYLHKADRAEGFATKAGKPMIRFCLPTVNPNTGQASNGIIKILSNKLDWDYSSDDVKHTALGGSDAWDPTKYCNIWVARLKDDVAGYAQMPGGPAASDGIVLNYKFFGRAGRYVEGTPRTDVYSLGRTLVHLMGTYLNLYELWNDDYPCADDYVDDTPNHNAPNFELNTYKHVSLCDDNPVEMTMNLMDCTPDTAQYMFTRGQVMRMQACFAPDGYRRQLLQTPTLCVPNLSSGNPDDRQSPTLVATGDEIQIRVFPNPTTGAFSFEINKAISNEPLDVRIFDLNGIVHWRRSIAETNQPIPVSAENWPSGIYTIQAVSGKRQQTVRVLLEKQ